MGKYSIVIVVTPNMRVCQLLLLGVLLLLKTNGAGAQDECAKGFPFTCFVHLWENVINVGKEFVHAFNTEAFFDAHCKDVEKCNTDCVTAKTKVDKSDVRNKGFIFRCNPRNLFCSEKKNVECIPIRKVYRLSEKGSSSSVQPASQEPVETTTTVSHNSTTTTQKPLSTRPAKRPKRQITLHKRDDTTKTKAPSGPASSDSDSFVPELVEIKTIVFPICRREDTEKDCMALTSGRFCTIKEAIYLFFSHEFLPWNDTKSICTIVESPLGGESPKWFAEYVANKKENLKPLETVWEYTGFPFDIVTNKRSPFLAHRHDHGTMNCKKYAENTENCLPLPICEHGKNFTAYHIQIKNALNPNDAYYVQQRKSECERACEVWEEPTLNNPCRILDIEHLPLHRQNSPPYAKFATVADNLQRRKFGLTARNERPNLHEVITEKAPLARRDAAANLIIPTRYYGRPIDLKTVDEKDYADIESNYWLSIKRNPFYKKYGDKIKLVKASMCTSDSKETFCRSPQTTPDSNANKTYYHSTTAAAEKSGSLSWWAILLIVLASLVIICYVILLITSRIGVSVWLFWMKKKRTKRTNSIKLTQSMRELQIPLLVKSLTGQTGHPKKLSTPEKP